jgi:hypothetical protein
MIPSPSPVFQFFKTDGTPAAGYKLKTYLAGTTADAATYQDANGSTLHTNPVELDVNGSASIFIDPAVAYKYVLTTAADAVVATWDNIQSYNPSSVINYDQETVVISSGTATITKPMALIDTEAAAATDDLTTITKSTATTGDILYISAVNSGRAVVIKNGTSTNNIMTKSGGDYTLVTGNWMFLRFNGIAWVEVEGSISKQTIEEKLIGYISSHSHNFYGFKNLLVNGDFSVSQEFSAASTPVVAGAALKYVFDQWYAFCTGANVTIQQIAGPLANTYRARFTGLASVSGIGIGQRLEAIDTSHLAGQMVTLQCKLSSSALTSITWAAYYATTTDAFGTLASPARTQIATGNFAITSTEGTYSAQISLPDVAVTGLEIVFTGGALLGSQTLTIGDVQIEYGLYPSDFERLPMSTRMQRCLRHYEKGKGAVEFYASTIGAYSAYRAPFKETKRVSPSITYGASGTVNVAVYQADTPTIDSVRIVASSAASGSSAVVIDWIADARM